MQQKKSKKQIVYWFISISLSSSLLFSPFPFQGRLSGYRFPTELGDVTVVRPLDNTQLWSGVSIALASDRSRAKIPIPWLYSYDDKTFPSSIIF